MNRIQGSNSKAYSIVSISADITHRQKQEPVTALLHVGLLTTYMVKNTEHNDVATLKRLCHPAILASKQILANS